MIEFQEKQAPLKCLAKNLFEKLILEFLHKKNFFILLTLVLIILKKLIEEKKICLE